MLGLSVQRVINVSVTLAPKAAATRNFGSNLLLGSSPVIDTNERLRQYTDLTSVGNDFSATDPEYLAAKLYFQQNPQPSLLYIGRWAQSATSGSLHGGVLSTTEQDITNFNTIATGSLDMDIDGAAQSLTGIDLTSATDMNAVASAVQTAFAGAATVIWNANYQRFEVTSTTTGATSTVGYSTAAATGTDLGPLMLLTSANASMPVAGIAAESLNSAVDTLINMSNDWYGLQVAATGVQDSDLETVAGTIEATSPSRIFGITTQDSQVLDPTNSTDICSVLQGKGYSRTFTQYSSSSPYAATSAFARAFTVNFLGQNTTLTLKFKQEPGVTAETLNASQVAALEAKNCNVFVNYDNDTAILEQGVMADGTFFDEQHDVDWLENFVQTNLYNFFYQSPTKIPQTDGGVNLLLTNIEKSCDQAVRNGMLAPGVWTSSLEFGALKTGDTLTKGYYAYAPPVATQSAADRNARRSPVIQAAAKLAGAIHSVDLLINVNR